MFRAYALSLQREAWKKKGPTPGWSHTRISVEPFLFERRGNLLGAGDSIRGFRQVGIVREATSPSCQSKRTGRILMASTATPFRTLRGVYDHDRGQHFVCACPRYELMGFSALHSSTKRPPRLLGKAASLGLKSELWVPPPSAAGVVAR